MNSKIMHPSAELLIDYIESPTESQFGDVRNHLIDCRECRFEANRLAQFTSSIRNQIPYFQIVQSDLDPNLQNAIQDNDIETYVDGALTGSSEQNMAQLLHTNKTALKSALHYATHETAMAKTISRQPEHGIDIRTQVSNPGNIVKKTCKQPGLYRWVSQYFGRRSTTWLSIPATAVVVFALTVFLVPSIQLSSAKQQTIASYQDEQLSRSKQTNSPKPGIGFFDDASISHQAFEDIKINYRNNSLKISWQAIQDAKQYTFSLYTSSSEHKSLITSFNTDTNYAAIDQLILLPSKHYIWELRGKTSDRSVFSVNGGFVIGNSL